MSNLTTLLPFTIWPTILLPLKEKPGGNPGPRWPPTKRWHGESTGGAAGSARDEIHCEKRKRYRKMCQRTTITIKKKGVQRRIVSNNNRCPCPTKRTKRRVQLSTYLYECSKWSSSAFAGDIICHRTAQNAEIGTETVTITCRETAIIFVSLCCVSRRIEAPTHLTETLLLLLLFFLLSVVLLCDSDNVQRFSIETGCRRKWTMLPTKYVYPLLYTRYIFGNNFWT